jgi:anaerobic selenocysteine-containing dehydrogenase
MALPLAQPQIRLSACPLDCPDACSLEVRVEGGQVVSLDGDRRNPFTQGFICAKVRHYPEHLYGPERLLHPGRRVARKGEGRFERLTWDQALDLVAERLDAARRRHGGESILPYSYGGSNGYLTQDTTDARLFRRLGASRLLRSVCAAPTAAAAKGLYGRMNGVALPDYAHSRLILVWGTNPSATGIHLVPIVREAQRRGAALAVVDPRRTPLAKQADLHLAPRPGTDLALALAIVHWLFAEGRADLDFLAAHATGAEELRRRAAAWTPERAAAVCGVPADSIVALARLYADSRPAVVRCGWGVERNRNGGSAVAAILALPAVAGKFGVRGGGYTMSNSRAWGLESQAAAAEPETATREVNMNRLGEALLEYDSPPVAALFVYNSNALATTPNQRRVRAGLERQDLFTVVFDQVLTDTARYADVVLPATTFLEHRELSRGYGAYALQRSLPAVAPAGEARPNYEVFADLCRRLGLERPGDPRGAEELEAAILRADRRPEVAAALERGEVAVPEGGAAPVQFVDVFPRTPDRKIHLLPESLDREAPAGLYGFREEKSDPRHPLALLSAASARTISSTFGERHREIAALEISPADAAARGVRSGDRLRVFNDLGEVACRARVTSDLPAGVVQLPKGLWSHNTFNGETANALAPDSFTDLGAGACFNDARVEVELELLP